MEADLLKTAGSDTVQKLQPVTTSIRINTKDRDDLRFDLRKHKRRVEELFEGRSFYELSSDELNVARKIVRREAQQAIAPTFHRPLPTDNYQSSIPSSSSSASAQIPTTVFTNSSNSIYNSVNPNIRPNNINANYQTKPNIGATTVNSTPSSSAFAIANKPNSNVSQSNVSSSIPKNGILSKLYAQDQRSVTSAGSAPLNRPAVVPSGSVPVNFSLTSNASKPIVSPQARMQETQGIRLIGSSLVDYQRLMVNAQKDAVQLQQQKAKENPTLQAKEAAQKKALLDEVDALLNRKSTHDAEASEEWHQQYQEKLKKLEKREYIQSKLDSIQFVEVQAFQCRICENHIFPQFPENCRQMGHSVKEITAIKRFFNCANCGARDSTLSNKATDHTHIPAPPRWACRCGQYRWVAKGSNNNQRNQGGSLTGETLVTAASESTSRRDTLEMAVRVSKLSELK